MTIIGCDLHTRYQVVAWMEEETGEIRTRRLEHMGEEVRRFYAGWPRGAVVGVEATFPALWFERLLAACGHELWVGDAAKIRASEVRQQKTDTRDAEHLLDLLLSNRFPRIWFACPAARVARWPPKVRGDRRSDWAPGLPRRAREFARRIMAPSGRGRIDEWWNPGSIVGFNEASLGRDEPRRIL
jgi:hypothetical protein